MTQEISPQTALVYTMVMTSAADRDMNDAELKRMGDLVRRLPVFKGYPDENLLVDGRACSRLVSEDGGMQKALAAIAHALPARLHETAYALAVEVAAADMQLPAEELRFLQLLRDAFNLDKLVIAAIERAARARHQTL